MAIIRCPECGHDVSDRAKTCPHCGVEIAGQIITCPDCGEVVFKDAAECYNCHCSINGAGLTYQRRPMRHNIKKDKPFPTPLVSEQPKQVLNEKPKPVVAEEKKAVVAEEKNPIAAEEKKPVAAEEKKPVVSEEKKSVVVEEQKPVVTDNGKPAVVEEASSTDSEETPKVKRTSSVWVVSLVVAMLVVLFGLYFYQHQEQKNEMQAYQNAKELNQEVILQNYLAVYPNAPQVHRDSVQLMLDEFKKVEMEWENAFNGKSSDLLEQFVDKHPNHANVSLANQMIDSLDWVEALNANTADAFKHYIDKHPNSEHVAEAREQFEQLDEIRVSPQEFNMLMGLFRTHFDALTQEDEAKLKSTITPQLEWYMSKKKATPADAVRYMRLLYDPKDVEMVNFTISNDVRVVKQPIGNSGDHAFAVVFGVDRHIDRRDKSLERFSRFKVTARVNSSGKIVSFNMHKVK